LPKPSIIKSFFAKKSQVIKITLERVVPKVKAQTQSKGKILSGTESKLPMIEPTIKPAITIKIVERGICFIT